MPNRKFFLAKSLTFLKKQGMLSISFKKEEEEKKKILVLGLAAGWLVAQKKGRVTNQKH